MIKSRLNIVAGMLRILNFFLLEMKICCSFLSRGIKKKSHKKMKNKSHSESNRRGIRKMETTASPILERTEEVQKR